MILRQIFIIGFVALLLLRPDGCSPKNSARENRNSTEPQATPVKKGGEKKGEQAKMDVLLQKVLNGEPSSVNLAKELGESAVPGLKPLTAHEDSAVRMLALSCINFAAGNNRDKEITDIFINALTDRSGTTSAQGVLGLQNRLSPTIYPQLLEVYDKAEDPQRRADIALFLGKIESAKIEDLKVKYEKETDNLAKEALTTAMAKLGGTDAKNEFGSLLKSKKDRDLKRFLDYAEYINQPWSTRSLSAVIDDKSPLIRVGTDDPMPGEIEYLRACDAAVNLVSKLVGAKFSFKVNGNTNYSDAQLQEVKQFLTNLR